MRITNLISKAKLYLTSDRLLLFAIILVLLFVATCHRKKKDPQTIVTPEAVNWRDKYNNEHAKVVLLSLEKGEMSKKVDSLAKILKIKPKQVTKYVKADVKIDTIVTARLDTITKTDTITGKVDTLYSLNFMDSSTFEKNKKFIEIQATVPSNPQKIRIAVWADIVVADYWERKKILGMSIGRKVYYTDIGTDNPYIQITNAQSARSKDQPRLRLKTGLGVGVNYDPFTHRLSPGIQLGIYLIRTR